MMNMEFKRRLPAPQDIINMYPVSDEVAAKKAAADFPKKRENLL